MVDKVDTATVRIWGMDVSAIKDGVLLSRYGKPVAEYGRTKAMDDRYHPQ